MVHVVFGTAKVSCLLRCPHFGVSRLGELELQECKSQTDVHVYVAQLVRASPSKQTVVGSSPTRGSYFFFEK